MTTGCYKIIIIAVVDEKLGLRYITFINIYYLNFFVMNTFLIFAVISAVLLCIVMGVLSLTKYKKAFWFSMLLAFIAICVIAKEFVHEIVPGSALTEWLIVSGIVVAVVAGCYWSARLQDRLMK